MNAFAHQVIGYAISALQGAGIGAIGFIAVDAVNVSYRKVGGLRFIKIGRLNVSFSVSRAYKPL